jgi:ribonuclease Z
MTAADSGVSKVDIVGPPDITQYISTLRSSVARSVLTSTMATRLIFHRNILTVHTHSPSPSSAPSTSNIARKIYQTPSLDVRAVVLRPASSQDTPPNGSRSSLSDLDIQSPDFRPARMSRDKVEVWAKAIVGDMFQTAGQCEALHRNLNSNANALAVTKGRNLDPRVAMAPASLEEQATEMVYICQAPPIPGKFDARRSLELGVPNGPIRGRLVKGETVEFEVDGEKRVVRPEDVVSGKAPGAVSNPKSIAHSRL